MRQLGEMLCLLFEAESEVSYLVARGLRRDQALASVHIGMLLGARASLVGLSVGLWSPGSLAGPIMPPRAVQTRVEDTTAIQGELT